MWKFVNYSKVRATQIFYRNTAFNNEVILYDKNSVILINIPQNICLQEELIFDSLYQLHSKDIWIPK